jgi:hypothetical protein
VLVLLAVGLPVSADNQGEYCPQGWIKYRLSCYYFSEDYQNWFNAAEQCRRMGSHLVTVEDANEDAFLGGYLKLIEQFPAGRVNLEKWPYGSEDFSVTWIGLNDLRTEGKYRWVDTASNSTYTNWSKTQATNHSNKEHCLHYWPWHNSLQTGNTWNDLRCDLLGTYICEMGV